ncbi:MAG: hypothetical protein OXC98_06885 [bacterium]|nr:hypothetical protein [Acidimicrobiia bacterium]MCY4650077.1 hypothetical protein [bacterium]
MTVDLLPPQVAAAVQSTGMPFRVVPCDPDFADTFPYCDKYGVDLQDAANTILVASKRPRGKLAACVLLATTRLDVNHRVKKVMGVSRLSFASAEVTKKVTGMEIGGVNPFGLPEDLPLLIDSAVMEREEILLGAGSRTAKIFADPRVLSGLPNASVVEGLAFVS